MACAWCSTPISGRRAGTRFCSKRCWGVAYRFTNTLTAVAVPLGSQPMPAMTFAYADPPYPGHASDYRDHRDYAGEVDHDHLIGHLAAHYATWALSTSAVALPAVLAICTELGLEVRVAVWVRGWRPNPNPQGPLSSWEPVVYTGARPGTRRADSLVYAARPRLADPGWVQGAKPAAFAAWLFELLGARPGDTFVDLYPGSGGMTKAWDHLTANTATQ